MASYKQEQRGGKPLTRFQENHRNRRNGRRRQRPITHGRIPLREHADDEHVQAHEE